LPVLRGATGVPGIGISKTFEGPLCYRIRDGAGEVEGSKGVEAFDAAAGSIADAGDAGTVERAVLGVDLLYRFLADRFPGFADAAGRLDAGDRGYEARAGDPEARRHLAAPLVLYDAWEPERAAGDHAEGFRGTAELARDSVVVLGGFTHQVSVFRFLADNTPADT
jgi:hypothetical protein